MLMSSPVNVIVSEAAAESGEGAVLLLLVRARRHPALLGTWHLRRRSACAARAARPARRRRMPDYTATAGPRAGYADDRCRRATGDAVESATGDRSRRRRCGHRPSRHGRLAEAASHADRGSRPADPGGGGRVRHVGWSGACTRHARARPGHPRRAAARPGPAATDPIELAEGDALLLHGRWSALDALSRDRDVLLVDSPELVRRQAVPWGAKATRAVLVLAALVGDAGQRPGAARDRRPRRGRGDGAAAGGHRPRRPTAPSPGRPWCWSAR